MTAARAWSSAASLRSSAAQPPGVRWRGRGDASCDRPTSFCAVSAPRCHRHHRGNFLRICFLAKRLSPASGGCHCRSGENCAMRMVSALGWGLIGLLFVTACARIQNFRSVEQPMGVELSASIVGPIVRVEKSSDLSNVFGRADLFQRKTEKGVC